jgi:hypothetical protein
VTMADVIVAKVELELEVLIVVEVEELVAALIVAKVSSRLDVEDSCEDFWCFEVAGVCWTGAPTSSVV